MINIISFIIHNYLFAHAHPPTRASLFHTHTTRLRLWIWKSKGLSFIKKKCIAEASGTGAPYWYIFAIYIYIYDSIYYICWPYYVLKVCALMLHTHKCLHIHGRKRYRHANTDRLDANTHVPDAYTGTHYVLHVCALMLHTRQHTRGKDAMMLHDLSSLKKKTGEASGNDAAKPQLSGGCDTQNRRLALPAVSAGYLFFHSPSNHLYLFVHAPNLLCFIRLRDRGGEGG